MNDMESRPTNNYNHEEEMVEIDLTQLIRVIFGRWYIIVGITVLALLGAALFNFFSDPVYKSSAKLIVETQDSMGSQMLFSDIQSSGPNLANRMQIIRSPLVIDRALGLLQAAGKEEANKYLADRRKQLGNKLQTSNIANTDIIIISFTAGSPQITRDIVQAIGTAYREYRQYQSQEQSRNVLNFLENQLQKSEKEVNEAEEKIRNYQREEGIISLDDEASKLNDQLSELENQRITAFINLKEKEIKLDQINKRLQAQRSTLAEDAIVITPSLVQRLREQLSELNAKRIDYLNRGLAEEAPEIVNLNSRISNLEESIRKYTRQMAQTEDYVNNEVKSYNMLLSEKTALESEIAGLNEQSLYISDRIEEYEEQLKQLSDKGYRMAKLERDIEIAKNTFSMLSSELEKSRIAVEREMGDVKIIEEASLPRSPIKPRKMLNLAIAGVLGIFMGTGIIFLLEFLDTTVKEREELKQLTNLPVLGVIPDFEGVDHKHSNYYGRKEE